MQIKIMNSSDEEKGETKKFEDHELKSAVDTLMKAKEIEQDPELMAEIKPLLDKKHQAIKKIVSLKQLRAVAKEKINAKAPEESAGQAQVNARVKDLKGQ